MSRKKTDVHVVNNFTFFMVYPLTKAAKGWIADHVASGATWFGAGLTVESRYLDDLLVGMSDAGLRIS